MSAGYIDDTSMNTLDRVVSIVSKMSPLAEVGNANTINSHLLRGYLVQGVSRGQSALMSVYIRKAYQTTFKIDLAGILYNGSKFKLKLYKDLGNSQLQDWFTTDVLDVDSLTKDVLLDKLISASGGILSVRNTETDLGHPFKSSLLVKNDELFPEPSTSWQPPQPLSSLTGSWVFSIANHVSDKPIKVKLFFDASGNGPLQLAGPAVMTLYQVSDSPSGTYQVVTDVLDVASPTPLRAGTKVVAGPFGDIGYGIIAANPREYVFTSTTTSSPPI